MTQAMRPLTKNPLVQILDRNSANIIGDNFEKNCFNKGRAKSLSFFKNNYFLKIFGFVFSGKRNF